MGLYLGSDSRVDFLVDKELRAPYPRGNPG